MDNRSVADRISQAQDAVTRAKDDLLRTFTFVPDDKLGWSPSQTARTPVWIVGHCGVANGAFAMVLRGEPLPLPKDPAELAAAIRGGGQEITTRAEAVRSVEESAAAICEALGKVTPALLETVPDSPFGPLPFAIWMQIPSIHMMGHARQVDYLQTVWGDIRDH